MSDQVAQAELLGALQFDHESRDRLLVHGLVGTGEVDQVRIVGCRLPQARLPQGPAKRLDFQRRKVTSLPLVAVFGEQLHRLTAMGNGAVQCVVQSAGDGHVSAEKRHR